MNFIIYFTLFTLAFSQVLAADVSVSATPAAGTLAVGTPPAGTPAAGTNANDTSAFDAFVTDASVTDASVANAFTVDSSAEEFSVFSKEVFPGILSQTTLYLISGSKPWWPEEVQNSSLEEILLRCSSAAAPIGLYYQHPESALAIHAFQGASAAAGYASALQCDNNYLRSLSLNLAVKSGMYAGYLAFSEKKRESSAPHAEIQQPTLTDLALSPVKYISSPYVWGSIAAFSSLGALEGFGGSGKPIWETDRVKIHEESYRLSNGIALYTIGETVNMLGTGIGEEAFYRGLVYESLRQKMEPAWAKVTDALLFPLIHLPQEIASIQEGSMTMSSAVVNFALRSGITLLLDFSYDAGGLELSSAVHTWTNLALHLSRFITGSGI